MSPRPAQADDLTRLRSIGDPQLAPDGSAVAFTVTVVDADTDRAASQIWLVDVDDPTPRRFTSVNGDTAPRWSPNGAWLAFVRPDASDRPQVWVLPTAGGDARQVTDAAVGVAELAWCPDSRRLVFTAIVLPEGTEPGDPSPLVVRSLPYKIDGNGWLGAARVHLFTIGLDDDEAVQLTDGDYNVAGISVSPDSQRVAFITALDPASILEQDVCTVPLSGGEMERLTDWNGSAQAVAWTPDGSALVLVGQSAWRSDAHNRLLRLDATGGKPELLADELDRNVMAGGPGYPGTRPIVTPDSTHVLFCVRDRGCVHLYRAPLDGGPAERVVGDDQRVVSAVTASADGSRLAYLVNDPSTPGDVFLAPADGRHEHRLTYMNADLLDELQLFPGRARTFATPAGEVHGWLLGPDDDEARPLLLDIHGGPHNAWGPGLDTAHLYHQMLAAEGWRVLLLNTPGSDGYGQDFYAALRGAWGRRDETAFLAPLDALVDEGLADPDRLAVTGYSYGGYMSSWLITQTDRFAAAVNGGVITNLVSAYGSMDAGALLFAMELGAELHEDVERYVELSPITHAAAVTTPTLILHGQHDDRCPVEQAEEWFTTLLRLGKAEVELVAYPGASHLFILNGRPSHRVDYNQRVVDWVRTHTEPGETA